MSQAPISSEADLRVQRRIAFFDGRASFEQEWPELARHINRVFDLGKYSHGALTTELEESIKAYTHARYAIGVNSGTDALELVLRAAGIGEGDEVIVPAFTFFASASSVCRVGATPVFADIEPGSYAIAPESVRTAMSDRTKAIMPVHLFTQMADMSTLREIAEEAHAILIEDSAEAIGMFYGGVHAGLLGKAGVLSFFPTKTLGALGDAGMVITDDPVLADRCAIMRHHGRMGETIGRISGISNAAALSGMNSKMDEIQAAVLLTRLASLGRMISRRADLAAYYTRRLAGIAEVSTPVIVERAAAVNGVWYVYVIEAQRRDALARYLAEEGIETEVYYPVPLHRQPCFAFLNGARGDCPEAERAAERTLALPFYPDLGFDGAEFVCRAIEGFYRQGLAC
jgi:dTDP-4-amino-4,6-dideoxygalactose transaminase